MDQAAQGLEHMESTGRSRETEGVNDSPFRNFTPYQPGQDEIYMNSGQLEHFRHILNRWRLDLMEEVDRTVHHMQDEAGNFPCRPRHPGGRVQH